MNACTRLLLLSSLAATTFTGSFACAADPAPATKESAATAASSDLLPGDAAPKLQVAKWVKGEGVQTFEKGTVYIVEFWATWCGPCRTSIPHLTELAKKHKGKVAVCGISVWESGDDFAKTVEDFVTEQGAAMTYNVGRDDKAGNEGVMATTWMEAAAQSGIPAAFIVNGEGKIAWIGHPMEMDTVLDAVLAGKHDIAAARSAAAKQLEEGAEERAMMKDYKPVAKAMEKKDFPAALTAIDAFVAKYPKIEEQIRMQRFTVLAKVDEKKACTLAQEWAAGAMKDDSEALNGLAWTLLENKDIKQTGIETALFISNRSNTLTNHENAMFLDTLALANFKMGDVTKAVELMQKAIANAKNLPFDPASITEISKDMQKRLDEYTKAAK